MEPATSVKELSRPTQGVFAAVLLFYSSTVLLRGDVFPSLVGPVAAVAVEWMLLAAVACAALALAVIGGFDPIQQSDKPHAAPLTLLVHSLGWGLFLSAELLEVSALATL